MRWKESHVPPSLAISKTKVNVWRQLEGINGQIELQAPLNTDKKLSNCRNQVSFAMSSITTHLEFWVRRLARSIDVETIQTKVAMWYFYSNVNFVIVRVIHDQQFK